MRIYLYIGITLSDYKVTQLFRFCNMENYIKMGVKSCTIRALTMDWSVWYTKNVGCLFRHPTFFMQLKIPVHM